MFICPQHSRSRCLWPQMLKVSQRHAVIHSETWHFQLNVTVPVSADLWKVITCIHIAITLHLPQGYSKTEHHSTAKWEKLIDLLRHRVFHETEQVSFRWPASELFSRGARIKSLSEHRLSWLKLFEVFLVLPGKFFTYRPLSPRGRNLRGWVDPTAGLE
jgi:hypothetical protein